MASIGLPLLTKRGLEKGGGGLTSQQDLFMAPAGQS